jgi:hypothetical protein
LLAATVVVPPNAGQALEILTHALQDGTIPRERILTIPASFPRVEELSALPAAKAKVSAGAL